MTLDFPDGRMVLPSLRHVGCVVLDKSDEVVVDGTTDGKFVILEVVQDWMQLRLHFEDVIVCRLAIDPREIVGGCCEEQCGGCCVC